MIHLFRTMARRLQAVFLADLALEFEAALLSRQADRTAELLVQAEQHERHGFPAVAAQLRAGAEALALGRPPAGVLPELEHWLSDGPDIEPTIPQAPAAPTTDHPTNGTAGNGHGINCVGKLSRAPRTGAKP